MYQAKAEIVSATVHRVRVYRRSKPLTYAAAIELWRTDGDFRGWFNRLLADELFPAYFWECPPVTTACAGRDFEFVVVEAPGLDQIDADPAAFAAEFAKAPAEATLVTVANLGGDALLIVPRPMTEHSAYGHLAAFTRQAPPDQVQMLWQAVGASLAATLAARFGDSPVWLSTAGLGVSWLHVRLDSRPKYYRYAPFTAAP